MKTCFNAATMGEPLPRSYSCTNSVPRHSSEINSYSVLPEALPIGLGIGEARQAFDLGLVHRIYLLR